MSVIGEATGVFGLVGKLWNLVRDRWDAARAQGKRLIETFAVYGIARQQIARILPSELKLPNAAFSTPGNLKDKVTPELLDWAAGYLVISRSWLDGVQEMPHLLVDHYQSPARYRDWMTSRLEMALCVTRFLSVWKPQGQVIWRDGAGPLCLIYEETSEGLDGSELTRYWALSDEWRLDHARCIENLLAVIAVTRSLGIWVLGFDVSMNMLKQLQTGKKLIPQVNKLRRGKWHPEDLIDPLPGQDSEWRQALWDRAQCCLTRDGIVISDLSFARSQAERTAPAPQ